MSQETEKIYAVDFISYTNCMNDTVSDWDGTGSPMDRDTEYLHVEKPFLIRESDIDYYKKFGQGFRSLTLVGYLSVPEDLSYGQKLQEHSIPVAHIMSDDCCQTHGVQYPVVHEDGSVTTLEAWNSAISVGASDEEYDPSYTVDNPDVPKTFTSSNLVAET